MKNRKQKNKKILPCDFCGQTLSDTPQSRWQHRKRNIACKLAWQKLRNKK